MSYPKDSSFIDMRSRIRTPVLKTRMILNELESMIKSPGQNRSFNELESRRWINTSLNSPQRRLIGSTSKFIDASSTPKPTSSGSSTSRPVSSALRSVYSSQTPGRWRTEPNPKSILKSIGRRSTDFGSRSNVEDSEGGPAPLVSIDELERAQSLFNTHIDYPIISEEAINNSVSEALASPKSIPRPTTRPFKRRNIDNGYKSNVFSAYDETESKRTKPDLELEQLQSLLKNDIVKECLLNGDGAEEFTFDKPEVRGPRKKVEEIIPPAPKTTFSTASEPKSNFSTPKESVSFGAKQIPAFNAPAVSTLPSKESFVFGGEKSTNATIPNFNLPNAAPKWECPTCMVRNEQTKDSCPCCMTPKPGAKKASEDGPPAKISAPTATAPKWECPTCMVRNEQDKLECPCCMTPKPGSKKTSEDGPPAKISAPTSFKPTNFQAPDNAALSLFGMSAKPIEPSATTSSALSSLPSTQSFKFGAGPAFSSNLFSSNPPTTTDSTATVPLFGNSFAKPNDQPAKAPSALPALSSVQPFKLGGTDPTAPSLTSSLKAPSTNGGPSFAFANAATNPAVPSLSFASKAANTNGTVAPFSFGSTEPNPMAFSFASNAPASNGSAPFVFGSAEPVAPSALSFAANSSDTKGVAPFVFGGAAPSAPSALSQLPAAPSFVPLTGQPAGLGNPFAASSSSASSIGRRKLTAKRRPRP